MKSLEPLDLVALFGGAQRLAAARSMDELGVAICRLARELSGCDATAFALREGSLVSHVTDAARDEPCRHCALDDCVAGSVILHDQTLVVGDLTRAGDLPRAQLSTQVQSLVAVPLRVPTPIAALALYWHVVDGPSPRAVAIAESIAAMASAAVETARRAAVAEAANRAKDELLGSLGHELRNALAPIATTLQMLELRGDDPYARERSIIARQVDNVAQLVDDLLDVSRISRGTMRLRRAPFELAWIVERALGVVRPLLEEHQHDLAVRVPEEGIVVDADVDRLTQVVVHVVGHAAKHALRGGVIEVRGELDGDHARLVVHDRNATSPSDDLVSSSFDPRVSRELSIVRSVVELHGGDIVIDREHGTTYRIRIPLAPPPPQLVMPAKVRSLRVLVVDDNIDAADTLGELLELMGHAPRLAYDGPSALHAIESFTPDIAFLDINLPGYDGYELARRLRGRPALARCPIVAITGYSRPADRSRARDAGFTDHLVKPLSAEKLQSVLGKLLG